MLCTVQVTSVAGLDMFGIKLDDVAHLGKIEPKTPLHKADEAVIQAE